MQLQKLHIERNTWGSREGLLDGAITLKGESGEISLPLDDQMAQQIVAICAEAMVRVTKETAENMTAEIIAATPALAAPAE
jgi:hypothetical protein